MITDKDLTEVVRRHAFERAGQGLSDKVKSILWRYSTGEHDELHEAVKCFFELVGMTEELNGMRVH